MLNGGNLSFGDYLNQMDKVFLFYVIEITVLLIINWKFLVSGQTIGMRLIGTRVVMSNGDRASKITVTLRLVISGIFAMDGLWYCVNKFRAFIIPP